MSNLFIEWFIIITGCICFLARIIHYNIEQDNTLSDRILVTFIGIIYYIIINTLMIGFAMYVNDISIIYGNVCLAIDSTLTYMALKKVFTKSY